MRMVIVMSVWGWATARQCRQSGSTLYCTGAMDEHQGSDIETVVVREWDREWCGETGLKLSIYARGASCETYLGPPFCRSFLFVPFFQLPARLIFSRITGFLLFIFLFSQLFLYYDGLCASR